MALLFFDIDGTLWDQKNVIPESTKEAIRRLKEKGHTLFLCSGRTRVFIQNQDLLGLGFDGIISGCGTCVEYRGQELLYKRLEDEVLARSVQLFYDYNMPMVMEGRDWLFMDADIISRDGYGRFLLHSMKDSILPIRDNQANWAASKFCILIGGTDYPAVIDALKEDYDFMVHGDVVMEVVPKGYSKATAIAAVCAHLGIDRADTYAFGDSSNDIDMLDYVATGIVMGNGTAEAKAHADYVTDDLHADGIMKACLHYNLI